MISYVLLVLYIIYTSLYGKGDLFHKLVSLLVGLAVCLLLYLIDVKVLP
jgi:hypothetical protein